MNEIYDQYEDTSEPDRYASAAGWEPPYKYQKELDAYRKKNPKVHPGENMLHVQPASEWMVYADVEPVARQLFGDLWKEGELAIMFADTGVGKSILAVQIAQTIARGTSYAFTREDTSSSLTSKITPEGVTLASQRVLYLDFELSSVQFMERYSRETQDERRSATTSFRRIFSAARSAGRTTCPTLSRTSVISWLIL